jgi:internalin A
MDVFSNCPNLEYIQINGGKDGNVEQDISSISTMTGLKKFKILGGGLVYSLPDLSALTQLNEIDIENSKLMYIDGLANCISLQKITLSGNSLNDLSALTNLSNLTYLDLRDNSIQTTGMSIANGYFDNVNTLNTLRMTYNKLSDCYLSGNGNTIDRTSLTWCNFTD